MRFKVFIKNYTALTIGGGAEGRTDISLNDLIIPPSSIKGSMRTAINKFLPQNYTSCGKIRPEEITEKHKELGKPCDVCLLFGYPKSRDIGCFTINIVTDLEKLDKVSFTRVAIDDKTQKAVEGGLFSQEAISPESEVVIEVNFRDSCRERMLKLLLYSLSALRLWRLGRNAMIDLKIENICEKYKCDEEMKKIVTNLENYLW
ncbi:RAMP superfamily CRISPR-associated protein [Acidianus manzaensis]|uniref:CRISPR type III-associated protein domain-containing protein n=1 Tax=Acidianus manzaensis TaxID=282676 RepID=A0A1W6JWC3_9CREN|nr:RAMP superfamily CRISPR-associated protein [Acidianus manzaensis]ARM74571.1 hypothetical protein B6F84_00020 [Acidianus manzaensis]